jgi:maltooligosyltrehalose trehalohydrolase
MSEPKHPRASSTHQRRLSAGAEYVPDLGVHFRVWAPERKRVELVCEGVAKRVPLTAEDNGYFSTWSESAAPGTLYRYALDGEGPYPDPMSRFQPAGPQGPSEVIAPDFDWRDASWQGIRLRGQVFYELHVGTFSEQGTWQAAQAKLPHLRDLGVTTLELMPVAEFDGDFGWGYDGVDLFAPHRRYGRPEDFRAFVDAAHSLGLGVILDVVYNHLGPAGNYLSVFSPHYFSKKYSTEWGATLNFDQPGSRPVRDFIGDNAAYWIAEFHLDGYRLDATQSLFDESQEHIIAELTRRARAAAGPRDVVIVAENEPQAAKLARPAADGGCGIDGLWNDDFHHSSVVALTGRHEAYYSDYRGRAQEFLAAAKYGFLYQGQYYTWQDKRRGSPTAGLPAHAFVCYLENHDQVANTASGSRVWQQASPAAHRAMTALLLLGPWTPLLFQGQEWSTPQPFPYFADHETELAQRVHKGRRESLSQFRSLASRAVQERLPDPGLRATFDTAKLDWSGQLLQAHGQRSLALHRDLLQLRRDDQAVRDVESFDGAVLNERCLLLRWFRADRRDRLLVVNLGPDLSCTPAPEPLLAPPENAAWQLLLSTEDPRYGGNGQPDGSLEQRGFLIPGRSALLFSALPESTGSSS